MASPTSTPEAEAVPRRLGDYEILTELATGGVATVYVARHAGDAGFERLVAIKRVHRHLLRDADVFASLSDEARISALVRHPNVVATHEVLDQKGELCLVQEYVEGVSLALLHKRAMQRAGDGRLPVDVVARIAVDFLRGLHAAHEAVDLRGAALELVHRDVSPQNVLVGVDGVARLIDFGIARAEGRLTETRTGILKGKLAYMAPEQVGEREVDRRADLFATGVVLFELLAGVRPFDGTGDAESIARILAADADIAKVAARSPALSAIVGRALAKAPEDRWSTAEDLAEAIAAATPLASDGTMRACVKEVAGEILEERRESIREELGRAEEEALSLPAVTPTSARIAEAAAGGGARGSSESEGAAPDAPSRRVTLVPVVVAGLAVVVVVAVAALRGGPSPVEASTSPGETNHASASPAPSAPPAPPSSAPAGPPASSPRGATSAKPPRVSGSRPSAPVSATPSARPDLHANPYGR